jgi:CRP-like cAMP-binding protein
MAKPNQREIASELATFPFFQHFPEDVLLAFASMTHPHDFKDGEVLLYQGKTNTHLFFLRQGKVLVQIDGENVSQLSTRGDVVGEMSLINRTASTASVIAHGDVSTYEVSKDYLNAASANDQDKLQGLLDRVYASVLAERLSKTNEKAKRFETANRDLSIAQDKLKRLNASLEDEIQRRTRELVQKVESLIESHLRPTQLELAEWSKIDAPPAPKEELRIVTQSVGEVIDFLKPVLDLALRDKNTEAKRVLLLDKEIKQQNIARLALGGTGIELSLASDFEQFKEHLLAHDFDVILCDVELKEAAIFAAKMKPLVPLVLLLSLDMNKYLQALSEFPDPVIFVSRDTNNRTFTIKNISTTVAKIINKDLFGVEKYLATGTKIIEAPVIDSRERHTLIGQMSEHFASLGVRSTILEGVQTVCEELLMNAIYDAPIDKNGTAIYNHLPRTEKIVLPPNQQGVLRFGTDGILLGISVLDPFGALTKSVIMKYLESCYAGKAGTLDAHKGGAGRGLQMIVDNADLTIFNIVGGKKTEIISLFNLEPNSRTNSTPTFHVFYVK